jgi:phospholipase/carboxylesterase
MHKGVAATAPALQAFITAELERLGLGPDRLALVGFSQGTMLALHLGLSHLKPAAVVGFSGVLTGEGPNKVPAVLPPFFLAHGTADQVIPPDALFMTAGTLGAIGARVQWHLSSGVGHGIDDSALVLAANFLRLAFAGRLAAEGQASQIWR